MAIDDPDGLITSVPDATVRRSELADPEALEFTVRRERVLPPPPPPRYQPDAAPAVPEPVPPGAAPVEQIAAATPEGGIRESDVAVAPRTSRRRFVVWASVAATLVAAGIVALIASHGSGKAPASHPVAAPRGTTHPPAVAAPLVPTFAVACVGTTCRFTLAEPARFGGAGLHWTFGDGRVQDGPATISHTYRGAGSYAAALAVDLPGGTTRSAPVAVRLAAWARTVRLQSGRPGNRRLTATVRGPATCMTGTYLLVRVGTGRRIVARGRLTSATLRLTAPATGGYELVLLPAARPGGTCTTATSAWASVRPAPVQHRSAPSVQPVVTQTQPATHYTPPAPH